jgi:hypothetical protein
MEEWDVARASGQCCLCRAVIDQGQEYYAVLTETGEGFERKDYCLECWGEGGQEHFCFWRSRIPVKEGASKRKLLVDDGMLINFFERLENDDEAMRVRFRFVLALILMRKKLLRYEQTVSDGEREYWQMRLGATNAIHQVVNPKMDDRQIAEVSAQLGVILRGEAGGDTMEFLDDQESTGDSDVETETSGTLSPKTGEEATPEEQTTP